MKNFKYGSIREKSVNLNRCESTLSEWMYYLFPNEEIVFDAIIPNEVQLNRGAKEFHRYRPDVRIENLNLIIELDGINHFQSVKVIMSDKHRDEFLISLRYKVVRIPFFVQLTTEIIEHYFGIKNLKGSVCKCGFYSMTNNPNALNPNMPANFSSLGYQKYLNIVENLPIGARNEIENSIQEAIKLHGYEMVLPINII